MLIMGLDFTSAPCPKKSLTVAKCELNGDVLRLLPMEHLRSFKEFEDFLVSPGVWIAALDFPFGQPSKLIDNFGWPERWEDYVSRFAELSKNDFVRRMRDYQQQRARGDKRHFRAVDRLARSCSPMQLDFTPVAQMFYEGASRLLGSDCAILPFRQNQQSRIIAEGYPALVARCCIGKVSYKSDSPLKWTGERENARERIVGTITGVHSSHQHFFAKYGLTVCMSNEIKDSLVADATGDELDAVLCAVQAAWSYRERNRGFGIPENVNLTEGWIVDPNLVAAYTVFVPSHRIDPLPSVP